MEKEVISKYWQRFIGGDKEAYGKIYEIYSPLLTFYCIGKLKDLALAENCASEVLIKTFNHAQPDTIRDIENWLFTSAKNLCISRLREKQRHDRILKNAGKATASSATPEVEIQFRQERIDKILSQELAADELALWKLHSSGYENQEIAERLGVSEKTIANRKSEIRKRLRTLINTKLEL